MQLLHSRKNATLLEPSPIEFTLQKILQEPIFGRHLRLILRCNAQSHAAKHGRRLTDRSLQSGEFRYVFDIAVVVHPDGIAVAQRQHQLSSWVRNVRYERQNQVPWIEIVVRLADVETEFDAPKGFKG